MTTFEMNAQKHNITREHCMNRAYKWLKNADDIQGAVGNSVVESRQSNAIMAVAWMMMADRVDAGLPAPATEDTPVRSS